MALRAVLTAVLLLGIPLMIIVPTAISSQAQTQLDRNADFLVSYLVRTDAPGSPVSEQLIQSWAASTGESQVWVHARLASGEDITVGKEPSWPSLEALGEHDDGSQVRLKISAWSVITQSFYAILLILLGVAVAFAVGRIIAEKEARRLSAPLIYLAAQAEQVGSGQVRARVKPSGIEEIDLVQDELERTAERMAGRLAAERQLAADASHQLRTPLTALSMRLEEIILISKETEVVEEAEICLEQVERLTGVVTDLMASSQRGRSGNIQAVRVRDIFAQQKNEWKKAFEKHSRKLVLDDTEGAVVLVTPGHFSQALATLIENSLKYGAGTVRVQASYMGSKTAAVVVSDEGAGVSENIAARIFEKGVSGHGSTGIGLALAQDLIKADGGRLELTQLVPAVFTIILTAVPPSMDPAQVLPEAAFVSMGRRRRRI